MNHKLENDLLATNAKEHTNGSTQPQFRTTKAIINSEEQEIH